MFDLHTHRCLRRCRTSNGLKHGLEVCHWLQMILEFTPTPAVQTRGEMYTYGRHQNKHQRTKSMIQPFNSLYGARVRCRNTVDVEDSNPNPNPCDPRTQRQASHTHNKSALHPTQRRPPVRCRISTTQRHLPETRTARPHHLRHRCQHALTLLTQGLAFTPAHLLHQPMAKVLSAQLRRPTTHDFTVA